jgi:hypothetical protein
MTAFIGNKIALHGLCDEFRCRELERTWQLKASMREMGSSVNRCPWLEKTSSAYQFLVTRKPNRRGSVVKTLVVRPVSSVFKNAPVIAVVLNTFFI